jgi:two-component system chemotaxis response regulator CheB
MEKLSVLIGSASALKRARVAQLVGSAPDMKVAAVCSDLSEVFLFSEMHEPDIVILSEEMKDFPDFEAMESVFYALDARWLLLTDKPARPSGKLLKGRTGESFPEPGLDPSMTAEQFLTNIRRASQILRSSDSQPKSIVKKSSIVDGYDKTVVIGSSTGGIDALMEVLAEFPEDCPPTAIVQHTGNRFSDSLIRLLDKRCKARVIGAQSGLVLQTGMICVAGGTEGHLWLEKKTDLVCSVRPGASVSGHMPSVDVLFKSALSLAPKVVGVLLTGMGQDGAAGLLELRRAGCLTIGQDKETSVVYGMPRAAYEMGAVQMQLPIQKIGAAVLQACSRSSSGSSLGRRLAQQ